MSTNEFQALKFFLKRHSLSFILGILSSIVGFYIFISGSPSPDHNAPAEIKKYRWMGIRRGYGEFYDTAGFKDYLNDFYSRIADTDLTDSVDPSTGKHHTHTFNNHRLVWNIGFYWKIKKDTTDNKVKHAFCIIQTLVDTNTNNGKNRPLVFDYFYDTQKFYNHKNDYSSYYEKITGGGNSYDNGQLW